jgi:Na+/H+ antiporter NhaD/arsenite permease-like protein
MLEPAFCIALFFVVGYLFIIFEHPLKINKATTALMMGVLCWVFQFANGNSSEVNMQHLGSHLADISQVIVFLLGALIIVEIINAHQGFNLILKFLRTTSKRKILWIVGFLSFFLSAILDNLTTALVMISLMQKFIKNPKDRLLIGGGIVIAANAGGVWTPIGDVTTTMLWIGGQITTFNTIRDLFLPSFVSFIASFACLTCMLQGNIESASIPQQEKTSSLSLWIFFLGIGSLVFVPIFKMATGLPPFMGIIFGLSVLWMVTDYIYRKEEGCQKSIKVSEIVSQIDLSGPLFFLGILLTVSALESSNLLASFAAWLDGTITSPPLIAALIGAASSIVDNIPLVAATMGMYGMTQYPIDSEFWQLIAYCAGTGGNLLIIGSAAGVVFMSLEKVSFSWYLKKITFPAFIGYITGISVYFIFN